MANITINESGLAFTFDEERLFLPETENFYIQLSSKASIKICDMVYLTPANDLLIIEVKSSSPRKNDEFVAEIKQKFIDSLLIYVAVWADRGNTTTERLPALLKTSDALQRKMRLILIVKNHKPEWLSPLRENLRKVCLPLEKLFSLEETQVYNQDLARQKLGLTIDDE